MLDMCGMIDDPECPKAGLHRERETGQIKKSEIAVQKVIAAINNFTNPWRIPIKDKLFSLASGAPVPHENEDDLLNAEALGKSLKDTFIQDRLTSSSQKGFFEPVKGQRLQTMEVVNKKIKLKTMHNLGLMVVEGRDMVVKKPVHLLLIVQLEENLVNHVNQSLKGEKHLRM